jgi:hypothetical protein
MSQKPIETRQCWTISAPQYLANARQLNRWAGIHILVMILSKCRMVEEIEFTQARALGQSWDQGQAS